MSKQPGKQHPIEGIATQIKKIQQREQKQVITPTHLLTAILELDSQFEELCKRNTNSTQVIDYAAIEQDLKDMFAQEPVLHYNRPNPSESSDFTEIMKATAMEAQLTMQEGAPFSILVPVGILLEQFTDTTQAKLLMHYGITAEMVREEIDLVANAGKSAIEMYCVDLNQRAEDGKIDAVIGRDTEIANLIHVLARRKKANVMLVGEPGVGKTAIAEGLALNIVKGNVPEQLKDKRVYAAEVGTLMAGTRFRGDLEERVKRLVTEFRAKNGTAILFIDEIHMVIGAGGHDSNSVDISNLLKPALADGSLICIGATTNDEFTRIERDRALLRRFTKQDIDEPSVADAKAILSAASNSYETFHGVSYDAAVVDTAVELAVKFIKSKKLPDKAFDVIDQAGASVKLAGRKRVTADDIVNAVSKLSKIGPDYINDQLNTKVADLKANISRKLFGQDAAITAVTNSVMLSKSGLRKRNKPVGNFLCVGPTGTGKTELAKQLAAEMGIKLIRFDMSEYMESHSVSKLIGAPPGYVGHGEGANGNGQLIGEIERNPHCVLLIDEVEKAHPSIMQLFLQIMDDARLTASNGRLVNFSDVLILFTSNLGAADADRNGIGLIASDRSDISVAAIEKQFAPEFRNRLDEVVMFKKLEESTLHLIVKNHIKDLTLSLSTRAAPIKIEFSDDAVAYLVKHGYDPKMGARPLERLFERKVKVPLATKLVTGELAANSVVNVDVISGDLIVSLPCMLTS